MFFDIHKINFDYLNKKIAYISLKQLRIKLIQFCNIHFFNIEKSKNYYQSFFYINFFSIKIKLDKLLLILYIIVKNILENIETNIEIFPFRKKYMTNKNHYIKIRFLY